MSFSNAQNDAVTFGKGPVLVLAGPGSGKTLTIVNRIKYLIEKEQVRPEEILVITFTKYAAKEMKQRFLDLIGKQKSPVTIGTFHGIYYGILKWAYRFGPENILSDAERNYIIKKAVSCEEIEILDEEDFISDIGMEIGYVKNSMISIDEFRSKKCNADAFRNIYRDYETERKKRRKIDFDDMLVLCYQLFTSRPDILKMWQNKFKYILIDEFQDINQIQYDVIKMLAAPENNIFVVGDDDQSIYRFRGADSKLMFQFMKDFPKASKILLDINFRSGANIVRQALKVIENNEERFEKDINTSRDKGNPVHVQETLDPLDEAEYVIKDIKLQIEKGVQPEDIAILYRIHTDARTIVECLMDRGIDFQMKEHLPNIYDHFIAQDIIAYFKLACGNKDRREIIKVMNKPVRYISRDALSKKEFTFEQIRKFYIDKEWMQDRIDQLEWDLKMMYKMKPDAAIRHLRKKIGYDEFLRDYAKEKNIPYQDLVDVAKELEESASKYESLEKWLTHVEKYSEELKQKDKSRMENSKGINLMTIHGAKGLEFDTVYIVEANEGQMPYKKSLKEGGLEEERRLFYVAMTRAKNTLKIVYTKIKNGKDRNPSRFVDELFFV